MRPGDGLRFDTWDMQRRFAWRMKETRMMQGLSKQDLVDRLYKLGWRTSASVIGRLESTNMLFTGEPVRPSHKLGLDEAAIICQALDVSWSDLVDSIND